MKQLIITWPNYSDKMSVEKLGDLCAYASEKPYFYVTGERSSVVRIFQGDSARTFEFDGIVYDPKSTSDFMNLYSALEFYLLEGVL